jgi:hypothetical protein
LDKHNNPDLLNVPIERDIVPGSRTESITKDILSGEKGAYRSVL